jgi:hypothetical protein
VLQRFLGEKSLMSRNHDVWTGEQPRKNELLLIRLNHLNNSFAAESRLDAKQRLIDQLDLFLQPLIRPVPLILQDVANQRADLANIGVVDAN